MPRYKDPPAVRVYTPCDESRYLIVRNVPALGCGDDLLKLLSTYGDVEDFKPMDAEDCEQFTDVYWVKFRLVSNARFAKRKLDEFVFLGNRLQVKYAPQFESVEDTMDKLDGRRKEVLARLNLVILGNVSATRTKGPRVRDWGSSGGIGLPTAPSIQTDHFPGQEMNSYQVWDVCSLQGSSPMAPPVTRISSNEDYFALESMNQRVKLVRDKLDKIQSSSKEQAAPAPKKARVDNRRRI